MKPIVRVLKYRGELEVWLCDRGQPLGTVKPALAADALRHGEDLIDDLVDQTLREADRRAASSG